jgi:hypothetical protein
MRHPWFSCRGCVVAVWDVQIWKYTGGFPPFGKQWMNAYHVDVAGPEDAIIAGQGLAAMEAAFHSINQNFWKVVAIDPTHAQFTRSYIFTDLSGERTPSGASIPEWNVVRVGLNPLSFARPCQKYYRIDLGEGDIAGVSVEDAVVTTVQDAWDALIAGVTPVCNPAGSEIATASVSTFLGMRQESWHRRTRPGFHRGYIPDA